MVMRYIVQEDNECFVVTITTANSSDVIEGPNVAIATIMDDDGMITFHRINSSYIGCPMEREHASGQRPN